MKIGVFGKNKRKIGDFEANLKKAGFEIGLKDPDMIISVGGDGTYFLAERRFPGIPKLIVRDRNICYNCIDRFTADDSGKITDKIMKKKYKLIKKMKLEARTGKEKRLCTNDLSIRNKNAWEAIRFMVKIDGKVVHRQLIGDGVVVATPFGSTGYYNSITRKPFNKGIGLAFNNSTIPIKPIVANPSSTIEIAILRGIAELTTDNDTRTLTCRKGHSVKIRMAKEVSRLVKLL